MAPSDAAPPLQDGILGVVIRETAMKRTRLYAGYLCVAIAFALIVMLGYGFIDPIGMDMTAHPETMGAALMGLLPSVLIAAVVFAIGLVLVKGARKP